MVSQSSPFLFSRSFDLFEDVSGASGDHGLAAGVNGESSDASLAEAAKESLRFSENDLERARADARAAGRAEAEAEIAQTSRQSDEQRLAAALEAVAERIETATTVAGDVERAWSTTGARVAVGLMRKLHPSLRQRLAPENLLAVFEELLAESVEPATLTVAVHPETHDLVAPQIEAAGERSGLPHRIAVATDATLSTGDFRVTWPGGGAVRDEDALWRTVEASLEGVIDPTAGSQDTAEPTPIESIEPAA